MRPQLEGEAPRPPCSRPRRCSRPARGRCSAPAECWCSTPCGARRPRSSRGRSPRACSGSAPSAAPQNSAPRSRTGNGYVLPELSSKGLPHASGWSTSSTAKRSSATGGGSVFTGKCAGSTSTSPLGVANQRYPSRERHADGWLLVAVSRLRSPSAGPNSIQCEQSRWSSRCNRSAQYRCRWRTTDDSAPSSRMA